MGVEKGGILWASDILRIKYQSGLAVSSVFGVWRNIAHFQTLCGNARRGVLHRFIGLQKMKADVGCQQSAYFRCLSTAMSILCIVATHWPLPYSEQCSRRHLLNSFFFFWRTHGCSYWWGMAVNTRYRCETPSLWRNCKSIVWWQ